eukprot:8888951-Alexandrium_andersonii.AAC.1
MGASPQPQASYAPAPIPSLSPLVNTGQGPHSSPGGRGPKSPDGPDGPLCGSESAEIDGRRAELHLNLTSSLRRAHT